MLQAQDGKLAIGHAKLGKMTRAKAKKLPVKSKRSVIKKQKQLDQNNAILKKYKIELLKSVK